MCAGLETRTDRGMKKGFRKSLSFMVHRAVWWNLAKISLSFSECFFQRQWSTLNVTKLGSLHQLSLIRQNVQTNQSAYKHMWWVNKGTKKTMIHIFFYYTSVWMQDDCSYLNAVERRSHDRHDPQMKRGEHKEKENIHISTNTPHYHPWSFFIKITLYH